MRGRVKTILLGVALGISACLMAAATPVVYAYASLPIEDGRGHDGSSPETAVVIEADYEQDAISTEYTWLYVHCLTCGLVSQSLQQTGGRTYDVMSMVRSNGEPYTVYFDITRSFGNW